MDSFFIENDPFGSQGHFTGGTAQYVGWQNGLQHTAESEISGHGQWDQVRPFLLYNLSQ